MAAPDEFADAASVRKAILAQYACRMHVAVILGVCFMVGLVRSTRRITSGGWISSVVGNTWIAFTAVLVLALAFAFVAQRQFPDAHSLVDVLPRL